MAVEKEDQEHIGAVGQKSHDIQSCYPGDEISLLELWMILLKQWRIVMVIFAVIVAIGLILAVTNSKTYRYTTTIELASVEGVSVEKPEAVLAKLNEGYIPLVQQKFESQGLVGVAYDVGVEISKGSDIILLHSEGGDSEFDVIRKLHSAVLKRVSEDHSPIVNLLKARMEAKRKQLLNELEGVKEDLAILKSQQGRLDEKVKLTRQQLEEIRRLIDQIRESRQRSAVEVGDEAARGMTLLLIDSEIQKYMLREADLEERLRFGIESEREIIKQKIADNLRSQQRRQEEITRVVAEIATIRNTRALASAMKSADSISSSRKLILIQSGIIGLMLGVFAAFIVEMVTRGKRHNS